MEYLNIEHSGSGKGFNLSDFPEAEKVISLNGKKSQELADMALHNFDLTNASRCLDYFFVPNKDLFEKSIFWKMAIINFIKCFQKNNARKTNLDIKEILNGDLEGQKIHLYFISLRNKNITHDDNPFLQCLPGAIINKKSASYKIEKIICLNAQVEVSDDANINNLKLLIDHTQTFVKKRFDQLAKELTQELELLSHEELIKREPPIYKKPGVEEVNQNRNKLKL